MRQLYKLLTRTCNKPIMKLSWRHKQDILVTIINKRKEKSLSYIVALSKSVGTTESPKLREDLIVLAEIIIPLRCKGLQQYHFQDKTSQNTSFTYMQCSTSNSPSVCAKNLWSILNVCRRENIERAGRVFIILCVYIHFLKH